MSSSEGQKLTQSPQICCAGEVMIELAPTGVDKHYQQGFAGDSFNTAIYLARTGNSVEYLSCLGQDAHSDAIIDLLTSEQIRHHRIARLPAYNPGLYMISTDDTGERTFSYWRENSAARQLFSAPLSLADITTFYFTGITLAVCKDNIENLKSLLQTLAQQQIEIIFDPNYRPRLWQDVEQARQCYREVLPLCNMALPTLEDETQLWGVDTIAACQQLYSDYGIAEIVVKAPDLTAHAFVAGQHISAAAQRVAAVDTTGAGDAFNAGYLDARLNGKSVDEALRSAQALAARVVTWPGALIPREQF